MSNPSFRDIFPLQIAYDGKRSIVDLIGNTIHEFAEEKALNWNAAAAVVAGVTDAIDAITIMPGDVIRIDRRPSRQEGVYFYNATKVDAPAVA